MRTLKTRSPPWLIWLLLAATPTAALADPNLRLPARIEWEGLVIEVARKRAPADARTWQTPATHMYRLGNNGNEGPRWYPTSYSLQLRCKQRSFAEAFKPELAGQVPDQQVTRFIVQFWTPPIPAYFAALRKELGATPIMYVPHNAYLFEFEPNEERIAMLSDLVFVRTFRSYTNDCRGDWVHIVRENQDAEKRRRYNIALVTEAWPNPENDARSFFIQNNYSNMGANWSDGGCSHVEADLNRPELFELLMENNQIAFVDLWKPYRSDMNNVREIGGAADLHLGQSPLLGDGVSGEILDTGFNRNHVDLAGRWLNHGPSEVARNHGASTSIIAFGDGSANVRAKGLLPAGRAILADSAEWQAASSAKTRFLHTSELVDQNGDFKAVFQSASVGRGHSMTYTNVSHEMDCIAYNHNIVILQSQGNHYGQRSSRPEAWAKNVVSVGGIEHYDSADPEGFYPDTGASIGPASDGRVKPELAHFSSSIRTGTCAPQSGNCQPDRYVLGFGGTSAATPIVAGHFGLLFEMASKGFFCGKEGDVFDVRPQSATARALIINAARRLPMDVGFNRDNTGWGMPDLGRLPKLDCPEKLSKKTPGHLLIDGDKPIEFQQTHSYNIDIPAGTRGLRATLVWTDPPSHASVTLNRVNDLDLVVITPDGTKKFLGNYGLTNANFSSPGGSADNLNTVENVFLNQDAGALPDGAWTVQVHGSNVIAGPLSSAGNPSTAYSLVVLSE